MPVQDAASALQNEGVWRFSGMWGAAYRGGKILMDVTEVTGQVQMNRIDVPLVGRTRVGHKRGRETREGTFTVQKIDSAWEMEVWQQIAAGVQARRAARDSGSPISTSFSLEVWYDDPDALGKEGWRLNGVLMWDLPLGFNIGDDLVSRQFTITWETEQPLKVFSAATGTTGQPYANYYNGYGN